MLKKVAPVLLALALVAVFPIDSLATSPLPPDREGDFDYERGDSCVDLKFDLRYRSRDANTNGEVSLLQDFLQSEGYLYSEPTGYFGMQTKQAAQSFQGDNGLSSTGFVGRLTRAKVKALTCGGETGGGFLNALPTSGTPPLAVTFTTGSLQSVGYYEIDYGDGTTSGDLVGPLMSDPDPTAGSIAFTPATTPPRNPNYLSPFACTRGYPGSCQYRSTHTYAEAGVYVAILTRSEADFLSGKREVGRVTIRVGSPETLKDFTVRPNSGAKPLSVEFQYPDIVSDYMVDFGDGSSAERMNKSLKNRCQGSETCNVDVSAISHTYAKAGNFTAKLYKVSGGNCHYQPQQCEDYRARNGGRVCTPAHYACEGAPTSRSPIATAAVSVSETTSVEPTFSVNPTSGAAPLSSTFSMTNLTQGGSYTLQFGDGKQEALRLVNCSNNLCNVSVTHSYGAAGTYAASLDEGNTCQSQPGYYCALWASRTLGTATITVTGGSTQSLTATPTSGAAPLRVRLDVFSPITSGMSIDFGDGDTETLNRYSIVECAQGSQSCPSHYSIHTYNSSGTYTARLLSPSLRETDCYGCPQPPPTVLGFVTITVSGSSNVGAPTINGLDAPTTLTVGQTGTWTVRASVSGGADTQLSYSVTWGDEVPIYEAQRSASSLPPRLQSSATFTHAYQSAGTYTPTFVVSNTRGSAKTSATVSVTEGSTSQTLTANPTSGTAPLTVSFFPNASAGDYTLQFGDGQSEKIAIPNCTSVLCAAMAPPTHTYREAGTYTASLYRYEPPCYYICPLRPAELPLSTVTITVRGGRTQNNVLTATPSSGPAPLSVEFTWTGAPSGEIDFGDGKKEQFACLDFGCSTITGSRNHTYTAAGTYTVSLKTYGGSCDVCTDYVLRTAATATVTVTSPPTVERTVGVDASEYRFGQPVTVTWNNPTNSGSDWVGIVSFGTSWGGEYSWQFTGGAQQGSLELTAPYESGTYQVVLGGTGYSELARSPTFEVRRISSSDSNLKRSVSQVAGAASALLSQPKTPEPISPSAASTFTYTFTLDLYRGQQGEEVRALQQALQSLGLFDGDISGNYYDKTREAVLMFQAKHGLPQTGYVGPATRNKLNELYAR